MICKIKSNSSYIFHKFDKTGQMEEKVGPVIVISKFNVNPEDVNQFLKE
jgi:hypothetical protein